MFSGEWDSGVPSDNEYVHEAAGQLRDLKRDFMERLLAFIPIGVIREWPTETEPTGWLECDGSSLTVADYPYLFAVLGYRFGGSGSSFNIPDMRGIIPRGWPHGEVGKDKDIYSHIETTGTTEEDSAVVTDIPDTTGLFAGMLVTGTGIPDETYIDSVDSGTQVTLTEEATADGEEVDLVFENEENIVYCTGDISGTAVTNVEGLLVCPRLGAGVTGTGIPAETIITAMADFDDEGIPASFTLSQAATGGSDIEMTVDNDALGSTGYDFNKSHKHNYFYKKGTVFGADVIKGDDDGTVTTEASGGVESRPKNTAALFAILTDDIFDAFTNVWDETIPEDDLLSGLSEAGKVDDLLRQMALDVRERILGFSPIGMATKWASDLLPYGYKEINGENLSRTTYDELFGVLGTVYGAEDSSHFNIPDWRGRFIRGWNHGKASGLYDEDADDRAAVETEGATMTAGDHVGTEQDSEYAEHDHTAPNPPGSDVACVFDSGAVPYHQEEETQETGTETRPININLKYIMRTDGIEPIEDYEYAVDWDEDEPTDLTRFGRIAVAIRKFKYAIEERMMNFFAPGIVDWWPGETEPYGYAECDGAELDRDDYEDLFYYLEDTFGEGDGRLTFNIPNIQGYFVRAQDSGKGLDEGTRTDRGDGVTGDFIGTIEDDDIDVHEHTIYYVKIPSAGESKSSGLIIPGAKYDFDTESSETGYSPIRDIDGRPKNIYLMPIIRTRGMMAR